MQGKTQNDAPATLAARNAVAAAAQRLDAGDPRGARDRLAALVAAEPGFAEAAHLLAVAHLRLGEAAAAEAPARRAATLAPRQPMVQTTLGDVLLACNRPVEAEAAYRAALRAETRFVPALRRLTEVLTEAGRASEALALLDPIYAAAGPADLALLTTYAEALKQAGRLEEACAVFRRAVAAAPHSAVAEHNLAALLGDLGRPAEAVAGAERALAKGLNAPETHLVRGRAQLALGRLDEAHDSFEAAVRLRPSDLAAQRELSQLTWMRTEDVDRALAPIDRALNGHGGAALLPLKAGVLAAAGRHAQAVAVLTDALAASPQNAGLHLQAARMALTAGDADHGLALARAAQGLAPSGEAEGAQVLCEALLAVGDAPAAAAIAGRLVERRPDDQLALATLATAWRLLGDPRYAALYAYDAVVRSYDLQPPPGWSSLSGFVADVASALDARHRFKTHPLEQSVRHGSQAPGIFDLKDPVLDALRSALDQPIRAYIAELGAGTDPLRRRNLGGYRVKGAWSVRLRPGGLHANHVHGDGWISSACYFDLPDVVGRSGSEGCLRFGEPGLKTRPALAAEHEVTPSLGRVVLFPSYMWHGTVPFGGRQSRLTAAFDLVPGPPG